MVVRPSVCLRRLAHGQRPQQVAFGRFLANRKVSTERLISGWSDQTAGAVAGRHVLAIQDTSEIHFRTKPGRRRGLGEIGKGNSRGLLLHAMLAIDASSGSCLGLVGGKIWTRRGRVKVAHQKRRCEDKESHRWITTAEQAKTALAAAAMVTVMGDRESDIFAAWARVPEPNFHLITRCMHDRRLHDGTSLYAAGESFVFTTTRLVALPEREGKRSARLAQLTLRFGKVELARPQNTRNRDLPKSVPLTLVEVVERNPPSGVEAVHWRILTTHAVDSAETAWQIVDWYKMRWTIEQFWRLLKLQGLRLEDSQLETAERLIKLAAVAAKAAVVTLQLQQARNGSHCESATVAFSTEEIAVLDRLNVTLEGKTSLQKNPHPQATLPWAAWIIAKLGGWDGYPSSKPPGPITFKHGLEEFHVMVAGWNLKDVCIP
jgi:Transposase DDE domain